SGDFRDVPPRDVLEHMMERTKAGVNLDIRYSFEEAKTNLSLKERVPLGAVLQWFEDNFTIRFVLRDYGIVVSERTRVPPGAMSVIDFWKHEDKDTKAIPK